MRIVAQKDQLADWTGWSVAQGVAEAAGLGSLVSALIEGKLSSPTETAFETSYAQCWLPLAMDAEPRLRGFSHWSHEDPIARFRLLVTRASELAAEQVLHRIQHGLPARDSVPRRSELGTLRHQLGLQRPSMPIVP